MRMALDLGLHRALDKLADENAKKRSAEEERDLGILYLVDRLFKANIDPVISARIWLCLYWFDHQWVFGI